jgi:hypothetical protein
MERRRGLVGASTIVIVPDFAHVPTLSARTVHVYVPAVV